jgi:hypothetical protein
MIPTQLRSGFTPPQFNAGARTKAPNHVAFRGATETPWETAAGLLADNAANWWVGRMKESKYYSGHPTPGKGRLINDEELGRFADSLKELLKQRFLNPQAQDGTFGVTVEMEYSPFGILKQALQNTPIDNAATLKLMLPYKTGMTIKDGTIIAHRASGKDESVYTLPDGYKELL